VWVLSDLAGLAPCSCSCSSAHFEDDLEPQIPIRGARRRAVPTVDDPTAINRAHVAARHPRHSHCLILMEEMSTFVYACQRYYYRRRLISLEDGAEEDQDQR
jgi:hypothetical protein